MSIKYILREHIDEDKYNECITISKQSLIYGYSWYLDIVCDQWDALILDDYVAVMPIPWRKKYGITYVYPPLWLLQLGIFSKNAAYPYQDFLNTIQEKFKFIELRLNAENIVKNKKLRCVYKQFQELEMTQAYDSIRDAYQSDRKKDLRRAEHSQLTIEWGGEPKELIQLFRHNVGKRIPEIKEQDYLNLKYLIRNCTEKNLGEICAVYQENQIVAAAFFLKHQEKITILCSSTDFSNRKNGANTFLIDQAIQRYLNKYQTFNFGGSTIQSIANYFVSFGANTYKYPLMKVNRLPFLFRLFKS